MKNNESDILGLVEEIENIETFKVMAMIEYSVWLSENVYKIESLEELQSHVKLEYGEKLKDVANDLTKINWLQILWYFEFKKKCEEKRRIYGKQDC